MIRRTSEAKKFNIYKFSEVLELRSKMKVISERDDFFNGCALLFWASGEI